MIQTPFRERDADYYDRIYSNGEASGPHGPVHDAVLDILAHTEDPRVLEIGCGTCELARRIVLRGIAYRGFDLSPVAVEQGRARGLTEVHVASAYDADSFLPHDYNLILALGVFEHIDDRRALRNFPANTRVLFSVPDYVETSHLRTYQDPERDILDYYAGLLTVEAVHPFRFASPAGVTLTIFLAQAVTDPGPCTDSRRA